MSSDRPTLSAPRIGVLLLNLGTPDGTDYWSMRRYLSEFLSDPRVIEIPRLLWQPILQLVILSRRPQKSGAAYASIWDKEADESPFRQITRDQARKLGECLAGKDPDLVVDWAMRYGQPSIREKLDRLHEQGCDRILLMPLYPQYSAASTATACDQAFRWMIRQRRQPALRVVPPYYDDPGYISAIADSIRESLEGIDWEPEKLLVSFHGMPRDTLDKGDPYFLQCEETVRLLRDYLDLPDDRVQMVFQSRFGRKEWLQPYADETIRSLPGKGVKRLAIVSPGFAADCLETLEELAIGLRKSFLEEGGTHFAYLPCLNDSPRGMEMIGSLVERELAGWLEPSVSGRKADVSD